MINNVVQDTKTAVATATVTAGTGISSWLAWIPEDIGKLATLVGIMLSIVLIYVHLRKGRLEREKLKLEMEVLKRANSSTDKCDQGSSEGG